jgi:hypothetical protein
MRTKIYFCVLFLVIFVSCSDVTTYEVSDGYFYKFVGGNSLLHQNGNSQLWRKVDGHDRLIWPFVIGAEVVTNGFAVFSGGLSDDSLKWKATPALLVCDDSNSVFEITEPLNQLYCQKKNLEYKSFREKCVYQWPTFTNGLFSISGHLDTTTDLNSSWVLVVFDQAELTQLVGRLKREGIKREYRGASYITVW